MPERGAEPRALFLFPDEPPQSDAEVCSGRYRNWLEGEPCPYSEAGRMPWLEGTDPVQQEAGAAQQGGAPEARPEQVESGEAASLEGLAPTEPVHPCVVAWLGRLSDWRGERGLQFPPELGGQPLLKCKQMFLLVLATGWEAVAEVELR